MFVIPKEVNSIDYFRNPRYRVFLAPSYFSIDHKKEIKWHTKYLEKLEKQKKNPVLFHKERGHKKIDKRKILHHKEWVIDSIPFHKNMLKEMKHRLDTITQLIGRKNYKHLLNISLRHGGCPEYFVYHKESNTFFFVSEHSDHKRNYWIHLVRDYHKICDVLVLNI